jgi:hypothetical protein
MLILDFSGGPRERVYEPSDYERFAQALYRVAQRGSMTHSLTATISAQGMATMFAVDYPDFDAEAFMRSARTGARYIPATPDESDERAGREAVRSYFGDSIEVIDLGSRYVYRYTHETPERPAAPEPYSVVPVLSSDGETWYEVKVYADGRAVCDPRCKGYRYRQDCRHLAEASYRLVLG